VHQQTRPPSAVTRLTANSSLPGLRDRVALSDVVLAFGQLITSVAIAMRTRKRRPWLAMVAGPLEMSATMSLLLWWTWPILIFCIWWWADSAWRWTWLVGFEAGLFGTQWTYAGAVALGEFPRSRPIIAAIWIACAFALAAVSAYSRRRNGSSLFYEGY
jgi:hypothetical protein